MEKQSYGVGVSRWAPAFGALALVLLSESVIAQSESSQDSETESLAEIDRRLNNPLTSLWSLTFQENYSLLRGDAAEDTYSNTFFFQPALPVPVGAEKDKIFIVRPVFPIVTAPEFDPDQPGQVETHSTGFGDMQAFAMIGPNRSSGTVTGFGATFKFPTASDDSLGEGKWQAGPAFLWFKMGKPWTTGVVLQHWWSFAGDDDRADTSRTELQYVFRKALPNAWSIGMGPTVVYDWEADSDNRLTLPIGLGITKTMRIGGVPVKLRFEPQYSIIRPDDFGTE